MHSIAHANIKDWAKNYEGELFDGILCDPPYELGFMGKSWDSSGIAFDTDMWADLFRILKPGRHLLAFSGSRTYHRMAVAIEDAGFEIRDMIEWVYGSGFPKSLNIGKAVDKVIERVDMFEPFAKHYEAQRKAKGLTHNQICEAGKFYDNHNHGGASSNWSLGANVPTKRQYDVLKPLLELSDEFDGLIDRIERERELVGKHETDMGGLGGERLGQKGGDIKDGTDTVRGHNDNGGSASRFFYTAKASKSERNAGLEGFENHKPMYESHRPNYENTKGIETPYAGAGRTGNANQNHHPTVKPLSLTKYLAGLIKPPTGGRLLVPFSGSGSEMIGALQAGWEYVQGVELTEEYIPIAEARVKHWIAKPVQESLL